MDVSQTASKRVGVAERTISRQEVLNSKFTERKHFVIEIYKLFEIVHNEPTFRRIPSKFRDKKAIKI